MVSEELGEHVTAVRGPARAEGQVELWLVVQPAQGAGREVAVEAPASATVADLASALAGHVGDDRDGPLGLFSRRLQAWLPTHESLSNSGLRSGDALVIGTEGVTSDWNSEASRHLRLDLAELLVAGGPQSGARFGLPYGNHDVGRDGTSTISIDDPSLSRRHLEFRVEETRVSVADLGSRNGTSVEGVLLRPGEEHELRDGDVVEAGRSLFTIRRNRALHGLTLSGSGVAQVGGRIPFNRQPRIGQRFDPQTFELEAPPDDQQRVRLPLFAALVPLVLGLVLYLATKNILTVAFIGLSGVMAFYSYFEDKRGGKLGYKRAAGEFDERLQEVERRFEAAAVAEATARRAAAPGAVDLVERALDYRPNLWERRPDDEDFLELRVGTGTQPARTKVALPDRGSKTLRAKAQASIESRAALASVPVAISLRESGAIGLGGPVESVGSVARWLALQVAVLQSPREVVIAAAVSPEAAGEWSWLKWLPHTHSDASPLDGAHLAGTREGAQLLLEQIHELVRSRRKEAASRFGADASLPAIVLLVDERVAPERAVVAEIFGSGPEVGVYGIWLGARLRDVPGECKALVEIASDVAKLTLTKTRTGERYDDVTADGVPEDVARETALALAPVRDTSERGKQQIPSRVSLVELLGAEPSADSVAEMWSRRRADRSTILGADGEGIVRVDLRDDGPHGLVAGMTGAGKSELLQTLLAGLALEHPPSDLTFLLIDCKGGSALSPCADFPHTVGFVTDLDGHLMRRVLVSLDAELRRREAILRDAGVRDLVEMEQRFPDEAPPGLLIVIDEFAALVRDVPEFVPGVVDVAQRGRSLGLHLILATQSPSGVVDDKIRANTNLRIALRVNAPAESSDVIGVDDAARLPGGTAGRGFVRTGHDELKEFQTAYVGGVSDVAKRTRTVNVRDLSLDARSPTQERLVAREQDGGSDLTRFVAACRAASEDSPNERRPWVEPLPELIGLSELPVSGDGVAAFGLIDEPTLQQQRPYAIDFDHAGSAIVYGASGSGKTSLLFSLASSLARSTSPADLHIYGLDFASRMLSSLEALPHCGSVIPGDDDERVSRLFAQLRRETQRRKDAFSAAGVFSLREFRERSADPLPRIVVLLDGYAGFASAYEKVNLGELIDLLPRLVADGRPLGIHFVLTADRRGAIPGSLASIVPRKIVLRMADDDDYAALGLDLRAVRGAKLPAGRGFVDGTLEFQSALVSLDASSEGQARGIADVATAAGGSSRAPAVGTLPTTVAWASLAEAESSLSPILGIGDDDLLPAPVDLTEGHFLIAGPLRSGRSAALAALVSGVDAAVVDLVLLAPRRSPLPGLGFWHRVATGTDACDALARELADEVQARDGTERPLVVAIDDADNLIEGLASAALETVVRLGRDRGVHVLAAGEPHGISRAYSGWLRDVRRDEHGLLLNAQPDTDGELLGGVRLPRRSVAAMPGRGYLVQHGEVGLVQVALVPEL